MALNATVQVRVTNERYIRAAARGLETVIARRGERFALAWLRRVLYPARIQASAGKGEFRDIGSIAECIEGPPPRGEF